MTNPNTDCIMKYNRELLEKFRWVDDLDVKFIYPGNKKEYTAFQITVRPELACKQAKAIVLTAPLNPLCGSCGECAGCELGRVSRETGHEMYLSHYNTVGTVTLRMDHEQCRQMQPQP